jgi:hypothetical protein
MKTYFEVWFSLYGITLEDRFALNHNIEVGEKGKTLCDKLVTAATLPAMEWAGSFPSTPEEREEYEEFLQKILAPAALDLVAKKIEPTLNKIWDRDLLVRNSSYWSKILSEKSPPKYELRPEPGNLCWPCGQNCHVCSSTLYYSLIPSTQFIWSTTSNGEVFNYLVDCLIKFKLGD